MGRSKEKSTILWVVLIMVSTNNLVIPVYSSIINNNDNNFGNEKNYYTPNDPHVPTTPSSGVHSNPSHHGSSHNHKSHGSPSSGSQSNCRTPPSHGGSGGSGGYYPSPTPTPITPPSKGGSGGSYHPPRHTPSNPPSGGGCACPSPPPTSGGSGGYYPPTPRTPTPVIVTPPSPLVPTTPPRSGGHGGYYPPTTPSSPLVPSPPVTPIVPTPPYLPDPNTPPMPFDPTTPPFPCTYWGSHPGLIFGVLGWWATVGGVFGVTTLPGLSSATSLQEMLNNPRNDGYGSLYREGTASFLNSMASKNFALSTKQVKDSFLASLSSDKVAAAQAKLFKLANEKKLKPTTTTSKP
ncbi:protodermal factor 1-like [Chenopodium quinoa]|uniref:protodermal factor 1-like n=1 Tax=Chenopodium quinoa TaxID=63459 RepID=UPI000B794405|nr:protodermal factor 1-like [Chenopodium quinoa]